MALFPYQGLPFQHIRNSEPKKRAVKKDPVRLGLGFRVIDQVAATSIEAHGRAKRQLVF